MLNRKLNIELDLSLANSFETCSDEDLLNMLCILAIENSEGQEVYEVSKHLSDCEKQLKEKDLEIDRLHKEYEKLALSINELSSQINRIAFVASR